MRKTSPNLRSRAFIVALVLVVCLVVIVGRTMWSGVLWRVVAPIAYWQPFAAVTAQFSTKAYLVQENERLRIALASTTAMLEDRTVLLSENKMLKEKFGRDTSTRSVLAGVLQRPPATPYDTLVIDAGSNLGITHGSLVSAGGSTIIGEVSEVGVTAARVTLYSAPGQSYQGLLLETQDHKTVPVHVEGRGAGTMITEVPASTNAKPGDSIILPTVAGGLMSRVVGVRGSAKDSFQTLYLRAPINMQELRFVEVLER